MPEYRFFRVPPVVVSGAGAADAAGDEVRKLGRRKALIVTDSNMTRVGLTEKLQKNLSDAGVLAAVFDQVNTEPTDAYVAAGAGLLKKEGCDLLVALGGGSPIDTAKAIAILAGNGGVISDYMGLGKVPKACPPVVAIPTTAGTGSEATMVTIITDTKKDVKMLIGSPHILPTVALADPMMTVSMPRGVTAATGMDALTHCIEAYVSLKAQPITDALALAGILLICDNLRQAWANGNNLEARGNMMAAALMGGMAFSNSSVALVHGMSRPIGAYFHVPHGLSNAALLATVTEFSLIGNPGRYVNVAQALRGNTHNLSEMDGAKLAVHAVRSLSNDLGIPCLKELGVDKAKLDRVAGQMARDAIASGSPGNNPRIATEEEIVALYHRAWESV